MLVGDAEILGCDLDCTCEACPEQYDVYLYADQIGYLRLRHGYFRADYPDVRGHPVYAAETLGDGSFFNEEREEHLTKAVEALLAKHGVR